MTTYDLVSVLGGGFSLGVVVGYLGRQWRERHEQRERERVIGALGSGNAHAEQLAQGLELAALAQARKGHDHTCSSLLGQALAVRQRARSVP